MKECSQCGRKIERFHRVYLGEGWCQICYVREFKHKPCAKCGEIRRLPRKMVDAVCDTCRKSKPCVRCGKTNFAIGKMTPYGPVCGSCSRYFREKKPCEQCGTPSADLVRAGGQGLRLCRSCYIRAIGTQSCSKCGRYRLLQTVGEERLCKLCAEHGNIPCPHCGSEMPAGKGKSCDDCNWARKLTRRLNILEIDIHSEVWQQQFGLFAEWLAQNVGNAKAAMTLVRYLPFFVESAGCWEKIPAYSKVMLHFKPKRMRRYLKVKQWLEATWHNDVDDSVKARLAEYDRIEVLESKLVNSPQAKTLLQGYRAVLMRKHESGKTTLKSVRLALQPAVGLLEKTGRLPTQADVDAYLKEKPGQKAAITGFINHLNREYGQNIKVVAMVDKKRQQYRQKATMERKLIAYMIRCRDEPGAFKRREWLKMAMPYFHKCALESRSRITQVGDMYRIEQNGLVYSVPRYILDLVN